MSEEAIAKALTPVFEQDDQTLHFGDVAGLSPNSGCAHEPFGNPEEPEPSAFGLILKRNAAKIRMCHLRIEREPRVNPRFGEEGFDRLLLERLVGHKFVGHLSRSRRKRVEGVPDERVLRGPVGLSILRKTLCESVRVVQEALVTNCGELFSLREVAELLALQADPAADSGEVRERAKAKIGQIGEKIDRLERIRGALGALIAACPGSGPLGDCSIMMAMLGDGPTSEEV